MAIAHDRPAPALAQNSGFSLTRIIMAMKGVAPIGASRGKYSAIIFPHCSQSLLLLVHLQEGLAGRAHGNG